MANVRRGAATSGPHHPTISPELALKRLQKVLDQIPEIRSSGHGSGALSTWLRNAKILLSEWYGQNSLVYTEFDGIWFSPGVMYAGQPEHEFADAFNSGLEQAKGFLESRINDLRERVEHEELKPGAASFAPDPSSRRIFVVHGHDHGSKEAVARFLAKVDLEPIILHEQADKGKTIIEKFVAHAADAQCTVVILTTDDIASPKINPEQKELRARQNVVFELGFFVGKLGRERTFALVEKGVALPSDIHGVVYIPLDWGVALAPRQRTQGCGPNDRRKSCILTEVSIRKFMPSSHTSVALVRTLQSRSTKRGSTFGSST